MSQDLVVQNQPQAGSPAPFGPQGRQLAAMGTANVGAISIESERAIAEARGQIQVAQMFPRDVAAARAELMSECDCLEFAQVAAYAVPRAGGTVTGPSIRLAEAVASAYGHMEWGHRELSRGDGKSEVEVYAWDKQKNNRRIRQITVDHFRDTKQGPQKLRDSKDIDDKIANVASKQMRGAILALVPKSFTEAAIARCRATLAGGGGVPLKQRVEKMIDAFAKIGVTTELLKKHLDHPLDQTNGDELADLMAIYNAIKNGGDKIADHFGAIEEDQTDGAKSAAAALAETAQKAAATQQRAPAKAAAAKEKPAAAAAPAAAKDAAPAEAAQPAKETSKTAQNVSKNANEQASAPDPQDGPPPIDPADSDQPPGNADKDFF